MPPAIRNGFHKVHLLKFSLNSLVADLIDCNIFSGIPLSSHFRFTYPYLLLMRHNLCLFNEFWFKVLNYQSNRCKKFRYSEIEDHFARDLFRTLNVFPGVLGVFLNASCHTLINSLVIVINLLLRTKRMWCQLVEFSWKQRYFVVTVSILVSKPKFLRSEC